MERHRARAALAARRRVPLRGDEVVVEGGGPHGVVSRVVPLRGDEVVVEGGGPHVVSRVPLRGERWWKEDDLMVLCHE